MFHDDDPNNHDNHDDHNNHDDDDDDDYDEKHDTFHQTYFALTVAVLTSCSIFAASFAAANLGLWQLYLV